MKIILIFIAISFSVVISEDCVTGDREKLVYENMYPVNGIWFKDITSGKYYFKSGNSIFLQRNDLYYSKWVINDNFDYVLDRNNKWTWDSKGMLYPLLDNCTDAVKEDQSFIISIICIAKICPNQIRFPSGGIWHYTSCKLFYDIDETRFELCSDGFYKKWNLISKTQELPDRWTWDSETGEWQPARNKRNGMYALNNAQNNFPFWNRINSVVDSKNADMVLPTKVPLKK